MSDLRNHIADLRGDFTSKSQDVIPTYKYHRLIARGNAGATQQLTIDANVAGQDIVFDIPAKVLNFYESSLSFQAAFTAAPANRYNFIYGDLIAPISEAHLYTTGGFDICRVNHVERYTKIVSKAEVKKDDAEFYGANGSFHTVTGTDLVNPRYGAVKMPDVKSIYEPRYYRIGTVANATVIQVEIPLSVIRNTILATNKNYFFNEVIQLRFKFNGRDSWGSVAGDGTVPEFDDPTTNTAALPGDITITNLRLNLALETNPLIYMPMIKEVQTGTKVLTIPYVHSFMQPIPAGTFQTVTVRLSGTHGNYLKKIYHSVFNNAEAGLTRYLNTNEDGANVVSYYTELDSTRLQESDIVCANNDDWRAVRPFVKGTLADDFGVYRYNWFALTKFDHVDEDTSVHTFDSGLPLNTERMYTFTANTANAAFRHYIFAVVTKTLVISSTGIVVPNNQAV